MDNQDPSRRTNLANLLARHQDQQFPTNTDLFNQLHTTPALQMPTKNESAAIPSTCDSTQFGRHALSREQSSQAAAEEEQQPRKENSDSLQPTQQFYDQFRSQNQEAWSSQLPTGQFQIPRLGRHMSSIQQAENNDHERVKESLSLPQSLQKQDFSEAPRFFQNSSESHPTQQFPSMLSLSKKQSSTFENAKNPQHSLSLLTAKNRSPSSPNVPSPSLGQVTRQRNSQGLSAVKQAPILDFKEPQSQIQRHVSFGLRREQSMCSTNPTNEEPQQSFRTQQAPPQAPQNLSCIFEAQQSQEDSLSLASRPVQPSLQRNPGLSQQLIQEEDDEDDLAMPVLPPTLLRQASPQSIPDEEHPVEVNVEDFEADEAAVDSQSRNTLPPSSSLPTNTALAQAYQIDDLTIDIAPPPLMRTSRNHSQLPSASNSNFDAHSRGIHRSASIPHISESVQERMERRSRENRQTANLFMEEVLSRGSPFYMRLQNNEASAQDEEAPANQSQRPRSRLSDLNLNAEVEQMTSELIFGDNSSFDEVSANPPVQLEEQPQASETSSDEEAQEELEEPAPITQTSPFLQLMRQQQERFESEAEVNDALFGLAPGPLFQTTRQHPNPFARPSLDRDSQSIRQQLNEMRAQQQEAQETTRLVRMQERIIRDLQGRLHTVSRRSQASQRRSGVIFPQEPTRPNYQPRIFPRLLRQSTFFDSRARRVRNPPILTMDRNPDGQEGMPEISDLPDMSDMSEVNYQALQPPRPDISEGSSEQNNTLQLNNGVELLSQFQPVDQAEDSFNENLFLEPVFESPREPQGLSNRPNYDQSEFLRFMGRTQQEIYERSSSFSSSSSELSFASSEQRLQNAEPSVPPEVNVTSGYRRRILGLRNALFSRHQSRFSQGRPPNRLSFLFNQNREDQVQDNERNYARTKLASRQEHKRIQLMKALELGYDSTFSEVEQVLDGFDVTRDDHHLERRQETRRLPFYTAIQKSYGVIAVLMVLRMQGDEDLAKKFLSGGHDVQDQINSLEAENIKETFYIIFNNVLKSVRELRKLINESTDTQDTNWIHFSVQPLSERASKARSCLESILSYFPNYKKIKTFLKKYDRHQKWMQNYICRAESSSPTNSEGSDELDDMREQYSEFKKQMRQNRIMLKICLDIRLTLARLNGLNSNPCSSLKLIKQTIRLHKSIKAFESQDFETYLKMFPNKLRCESSGVQFFEERKIQTLMKEKIVFTAPDFDGYLSHYSQLHEAFKSSLRQQKQYAEANEGVEGAGLLGKRQRKSHKSKPGKKRARRV